MQVGYGVCFTCAAFWGFEPCIYVFNTYILCQSEAFEKLFSPTFLKNPLSLLLNRRTALAGSILNTRTLDFFLRGLDLEREKTLDSYLIDK